MNTSPYDSRDGSEHTQAVVHIQYKANILALSVPFKSSFETSLCVGRQYQVPQHKSTCSRFCPVPTRDTFDEDIQDMA